MTDRRVPDAHPSFAWLLRLTGYFLGLNVLWGAMTTVILPFLVAQRVDGGFEQRRLARAG